MSWAQQPRSARRLVHDGRLHPAVPSGRQAGDSLVTAILGLQVEPPRGSVYVAARSGRVRRRSADTVAVRRRLWALRILVAAWVAGCAITLVLVVSWFGWSTAAFTHFPMVVLLLVLLHATRTEGRWLARVARSADRR